MALVKVTRTFPFRGTTYGVGSEIEVPDATAERMASARPPFGAIVTEAELELMTEPESGAPLEFTAGALDLLGDHGLTAEDYDGPAVGKVTKADVREWLEA